MIAEESEIKFLVSREDADAFIKFGVVIASGCKQIQYFDDSAGKLASARATYRRYLSKGVMLDELKTLSVWSANGRVCVETSAPAREETLHFVRLELSDISTHVADAVRKIAGDCVLDRAELLLSFRTKLRVPGFDDVFDIDVCSVPETGAEFCEIEFESEDTMTRANAREFITSTCMSAVQSELSKRERARLKT